MALKYLISTATLAIAIVSAAAVQSAVFSWRSEHHEITPMFTKITFPEFVALILPDNSQLGKEISQSFQLNFEIVVKFCK